MGLFSPLGRLPKGLQKIEECELLNIGDVILVGLRLDDSIDNVGEYSGDSVV